MELDEFNAADPADAAAVVRVWADVPGWVDAVVAGRPYASVDALAAYAGALAATWAPADLEAALAHHPRIGARVSGDGAEAAASRREQASMAQAGDEVAAAIAAGNAAYEERFGRIFLIRAAGRTPAEMRAELERRLQNDPATEAAEATAQLAEIALLRLRDTIADAGAPAPEEAE
jgi:2-oxo-4-hydroxy-4-carboxy-5-ureidoimidazoline decarboxylase